MGERSRWTTARWRTLENTLWRRELARFGPLPERITDRSQARERCLWQAEAYAMIVRHADRSRRDAARRARRYVATWEQIGAALGISRQAAAKLIDQQVPTSSGDGWMVDHRAG